ncbi:MAG TPA: condensation domain-containing protein [Pseudonocardiaceae bacterium]|nr:condensation domain-containing protein [Pseudonocardiaceae bacterium]
MRYPLSTQQAACAGDPDQSGFVLPFAMRITGHVDTDALRGALDDLVVRHEVMRTSITPGTDDEAGHQTVLPPMPALFTVHDLTPEPGRSRDEIADDLLVDLHGQRMDMFTLPLLRAVLHRFDDNDSVLTILTHHCVGDGWSCNLIRRDLAASYRARTSDTRRELPEVRQYWEYGAYQQEWIAGEQATKAREYWRAKVDGAEVYTMPADRPNGEGVLQNPCQGANFVVDAADFAEVEAYASTIRSSGWHVLVAAGVLLGERLRGWPEITLMTNTAGRNERSFNNTVGYFADFVPLRVKLDDCVTYQDVVLRARGTCLEAYSNLIPISVLEDDTPTLPLAYDVPANVPFIFNYSRPLVGPEEIQFADGVELITLAKEEPSARGEWCVWTMWRHPNGSLRGGIEYAPDLVDASTVELWIAEFTNLLERITTAPNQNWKGR